jgi:hypothetical protein
MDLNTDPAFMVVPVDLAAPLDDRSFVASHRDSTGDVFEEEGLSPDIEQDKIYGLDDD